MAAPNGFGSKKSRKNDQNFPNFFFRKKEYKKGLETQFHQNRPHRTDFRLKIARHEKITSSENGGNSNIALVFWDPVEKVWNFLRFLGRTDLMTDELDGVDLKSWDLLASDGTFSCTVCLRFFSKNLTFLKKVPFFPELARLSQMYKRLI